MISERYQDDGKLELMLNQVQKCALYEFELKLDHQDYEWEEYDCDCGAPFDQLRFIANKDRYGMNIETRICPKCGMVMTNPRMTQKSYNQFYDEFYRKIYVGRKRAEEVYFQRQREHGRRIYDYIKQHQDMNTITSVLEIGCGAGGILSYFRDQGIEEIKGIDLGSEYVQFGVKHKLNLENCSSEKLLKVNKKYDLVILSHVIEHFLDIRKELNIISKLLSDKGILYVEAPGLKNIPVDYHNNFLEYLQNAHIRHFTFNTLKQLMAWNGFQCLAGNETIQSIFVNAQKNTCVETYYSDIENYLLEHEKEYTESLSLRETKYKCLANKAENIAEIFDMWMSLSRCNIKISDFLKNCAHRRVAIYGYGILGRQLYQELKDTDVKVECIIDRKELNEVGVKCIHPNDEIDNVDLIIMTVVDDYIAIERMLSEKLRLNKSVKILPLAKILYDMNEI